VPPVEIVFYREEGGSVPFLDWFEHLAPKVRDKCLVRLERLEELGHEVRRPMADYLRDDIYELRVGFQGVNYRMLYFFHGRRLVVVSHGLVKQKRVPPKEIDLAVARREQFRQNPGLYTFVPRAP
jgi:phage-related protein